MKARLLEAAGAGAPVSGALAAALLAAAALLLVPGVAWGQNVCGGTYAISTDSSITCGDQAWTQISHVVSGSASLTITAPGGSATVFSGTATVPSLRITASSNAVTGNYAIRVGATGAVSLTGAGRGISIDMLGSAAGTATVEVGSAVTIGSSTSSMGAHGIRVRGGSDGVTITNAGTIYANYEGIDAAMGGAGTMTVEHTGAITSTSSTNSPGMLLVTQGAGPMLVTTSGDVTATTSTQRGIIMRAEGNGAITLTATGGTITSAAEGVYIESRGTGDVTIRGTDANTGPTIMGGTHGLEVYKTSAATAGDISITTTGGSIAGAAGNGIRAHWQTYVAGNGGISVTVGAGASVTGSAVGVYAANAGNNAGTGLMVERKYTPRYGVEIAPGAGIGDPDDLVAAIHGEPGSEVTLRNQLVTVRGTVTGGTGAAVYLLDGGGVLVLEGGRVHAGSNDAILATGGPALVYIDGEVRGGAGGVAAVNLDNGGSVIVGLKGRVLANGADYAIQGSATAPVTVILVVPGLYREDAAEALARVEGGHQGENVAAEDRVPGGYRNVGDGVHFREERNGKATGYFATLRFDADGLLDPSRFPLRPVFSCGAAGDGRCRMYEALPSMLLALNALPSRAERMSAPRDARGGWARVEASRGEWRAKQAKTAAKLAYDYSLGRGARGRGLRSPARGSAGGVLGARAPGQGGDGGRGRGRAGRGGGGGVRRLAVRGLLRGRAGGGDALRRRPRFVHARQAAEEGRLGRGVCAGGGGGQADAGRRGVRDAARGARVVEGGSGRFHGP